MGAAHPMIMERTPVLLARNLEELGEALKLVPRSGGNCIQCNSNSQLQCPACPTGKVCQFTVPVDCTQCAQSICVTDDTPPPDSGGSGSSGPNVGAIAGGVVGGVVVIAIVSYLVWRFFVKPKRSQPPPQSVYEVDATPAGTAEKVNMSGLGRRSSTRTVHSIASTVLTRASNIIQIAYIPGVTNRATPSSPAVLVPPVPPIPMHHTEGNRASELDDQVFFVPGNLRDSTYSGLSGYSDRTSYAPTSYAPRSSIASTIYGKQAQVFTNTQTGMRAKPTVVSVKSGGSPGSAGSTPPVPSIDFDKFKPTRPKSGSSAFSVGSTFLNNANTATQARAQVVKVGGGLKTVDIGSKSQPSSSQGSLPLTAPESVSQPSVRDSHAGTVIEDSPAIDQGPFSDPLERPSPLASVSTPTLGVVVEDAQEDSHHGNLPAELSARRPGSLERGNSPFGDQHATKE